ncbi:hypothetical protein [Herbiconiux flava]|uniref:Uncharacterized protein n=1 Tax=Herbiconiux flava TaxID=881268 RepID=A0A852SKX9_9MICO|nr:hypothetical protein [Herbiconiux flava]NYD69211.1 hypothetical protein [Herbiconiux flava]GLK15960.1 hypothetical protein GCM10017602_04420 [Herbiconiux flava]
MAKKTKTALKDLVKALEKHQEVLEDKKSGHGKRDRATAKVRTATIAYASAVYSRTGGTSPFLDLPDPGLDESTVASLKAEKEALVAKQSQKESSKHAAPEAAAPAADADASSDDSAGSSSSDAKSAPVSS